MKTLKYLQSNHILQCANIFTEIYKAKPFNYEWISSKEVLRYFTDLYKTPNFMGFVLFQKDILIGACFGIVSDYFKIKKYHISEIFINKDFQGNGIGSMFLAQIEKNLSTKKIEVIELSTDRSKQAFSFYKKNGYIVLKDNLNLIKSIIS